MPRKAIIVTFYSYRGGVGRTMAALNVAYLIAQRARRVLLIDMDLEAPGLTHLIKRQDLILDEQQAGKAKGLLGALCSFLANPEEPSLLTGPTAVDPYLVGLKVEKPEDAVADAGELYLMPAGPLDGYGQRLEEFHNMTQLFAAQRRDIAAKLREVLIGSGRFDYIFVDARTGLSDEGYTAARYLCDHLVVLSGLNEQNVSGTAQFLRHVAAWKEKREGPKKIVLVGSPVCEYEDDLKATRLKEAKTQLREVGGQDVDFAVLLPYHPRLSLYEELIAVERPESGLGRAYRQLWEIVLSVGQDTPAQWAVRCITALGRGDVQAALDAFRNIASLDPGEARRFARAGMSNAAAGLHQPEALALLDEAARGDPAEPLHPLNKARLLRDLGVETAEVLRALDQARQLAKKTENTAALAATLHSLAELDQTEGKYAEARKGFEEALALDRERGDKRGIAVTLHSLAELDQTEGKCAEARRKFEESLRLKRELGDKRSIAATLHSLAELDRLEGKYTDARKGFEEALALNSEIEAKDGIAAGLHDLAELDRLEGKYAEARKGFEESLRLKRELRDKHGIAVTLHSLAELDRLEGKYADARKGFEESLRLKRELRDKRGIAVTSLYLAVARAQTDPDLSLDELHRVADEARACEDPYVRARASLLEGMVLRERGDAEGALVHLDQALECTREFGLRGLAAAIQAERARCLEEFSKHDAAAQAAREALAFFKKQRVNHPLNPALKKIV